MPDLTTTVLTMTLTGPGRGLRAGRRRRRPVGAPDRRGRRDAGRRVRGRVVVPARRSGVTLASARSWCWRAASAFWAAQESRSWTSQRLSRTARPGSLTRRWCRRAPRSRSARSLASARCCATRTAPADMPSACAGLLGRQADQHPQARAARAGAAAAWPAASWRAAPPGWRRPLPRALAARRAPSGRLSVGIASRAAIRRASATLCEAMPKTNEANGLPMSWYLGSAVRTAMHTSCATSSATW